MSFPGIFIVIEGVDGAGKTTLAQQLVGWLNTAPDKESVPPCTAAGYDPAVYVREPGSTPFGVAIREGFLATAEPLDPMTEVLALLAAKNELLQKVIKPAVASGHIVIADRYTRSLLAYQGKLHGVPYATMRQLLMMSGTLIPPNLELVLSVDPEVSAQRRTKALNALDTEAAHRAEELREGFIEAAHELPPYRSITIDANGSFDGVLARVQEEISRYLKFHRVASLNLSAPITDWEPETEVVAVSEAVPAVSVEE